MEKLRRSLPDDVEIVIFPRLEPEPKQAVSNEIIPKILDCPGLIYLTGGASKKSFWVSFERDYALRSSRQVFAYSPDSGSFRQDHSDPIQLALTVMYHMNDDAQVRRLISWMAEKRHFEIGESELRSRLGGFTGDILVGMEELLLDGGIVLWLMSLRSTKIASAFYSDQFVDYLLYDSESDTLEDMWRDFLARKHYEDGNHDWYYDGEDEYHSQFNGSYYSKRDYIEDFYLYVDQVFARIDPELSPDWKIPPWGPLRAMANYGVDDVDSKDIMIDLFDGMQEVDFNWNRVDDLIIALYERLSRWNKDAGS